MGVDTKGRLIGRVKPEEVLNFIKQKYDANAMSDVKRRYDDYEFTWKHEKYGDEKPYTESGSIYFKDGDNNRKLFYYYTNVNSFENLELYSELGLEDMVKSETTQLILGYWGNSANIMTDLATEFGGWIDENDCDDESYYPIIKNSEGSIRPVIYVTMDEIYEKFGGVVVIKK